MSKLVKRLVLVVVVAALVVAALVVGYVVFDVGSYLSFERLKAEQAAFQAYYRDHRLTVAAGYVVAYILATALSLPVAALLTIAAGTIFGFWRGLVLASFASTIGATLAFLVARYLLRDWIQGRYGRQLERLNRGIEREGAFYLFTMRLIPAFPFWLINLGMAVTPMKVWTFFLVSQAGMLAGTAVYVNAGTQLAQVDSLGEIFSPTLIGSFALLGIFPLLAKKLVDAVRHRRALAGHRAPGETDYNVVVIGAGSGGLVSAYLAAAVEAKVALVERGPMGGDCLNTGCVPSKALIRSARLVHDMRRHADLGIDRADMTVDFATVMERVQRVIATVAPHDSVERYTGLGVDCVRGTARIVDPYTVEVDGRRLTTRNIVIATGAGPLVPPIDGIDEIGVWTSESLWRQRELPERLCVVGGGPIGCGMAQALHRLGAEVVQVEADDRIMNKEDPEVSQFVLQRFRDEGIDVRAGHRVARFERRDDGRSVVVCQTAAGEERIVCDRVLMALGRKANVSGFGLEALEVAISDRGTVAVDRFLRTTYPNIYAVGDVAGPYQFTHFAAHQAWYATVNALFSPLKTFAVDYSLIPWCTYLDPEVAKIGLNEQEAREQGVPYEVTRYPIAELDRAIAEEAAHGFVKVLTEPGKDRILGATIVDPHAGDLLAEFILAIKHGVGLDKILGTIHPYPTHAEANKFAAGAWKQAHKPEGLLRWVRRYHTWRRSRAKSRALAVGAMAAVALVLALGIGLWRFFTPAAPPPVPPSPAAEAPLVPTTTTVEGDRVYTRVAIDRYAASLQRVVDQRGLVDWPALVADHADLDAWYRSVAHLDPGAYSAWDRDRRLAFWLNVYNGLTLRLVVAHHPIERSAFGLAQDWLLPGSVPPESIRNIPWVWWRVPLRVMGREWTLMQIEDEIIRARFEEPRIHMALNCASYGCPPLRAEPYRAADLERQLQDQVHRFLHQQPQNRVVIDRDAGRVELSWLLQRFAQDFAAAAPDASGYPAAGSPQERAVLAWIAERLPADQAEWLRTADYAIRYRAYDWSLNQSGRE